jgi:hypothetical protein
MDGNGGDLPPEVVQAQRSHPECSFGVDSATSVRIVNGEASESTTRRYYMKCPGRPRELIHQSKASRSGEASPFSFGRGGWGGWGVQGEGDGEGRLGGGAEEEGGGLPDVDAFLKDFFGIPRGRTWPGMEEGRHPFPLPLPRPQRPPHGAMGSRGQPGGRTPQPDHDEAADAGGVSADGSGWELQPRGGPGSSGGGGSSSMAQRERGRGVYI